ncbi:MAG: HAD-IB family hydrolase [Actinomyces sp.]|uniref:HAD family hydrolase n=1 Tax=Actinomyces sp. TaxID=29317 RepID=UPI0026DA9BF2|nr:HAD-IB family hydrolase [Actinomyces sp.]MDO4243830.1 HAD-IB family hydrolase [Actinomyces sp.]
MDEPTTPRTRAERTGRRTAAYFDLDKTILATSTTLALGTPMRRSGIISTASLARGVVAQLPYLLVGADEGHTARLMTRLARMSAGVERSRFQEVVREALATAIAPAVYAEALDLIEAHRRAGHDIVVVSASGAEMVEPIAELVGADRAVATRMEVDEEGRFTGRIAHCLLHGAKVDALAADAAAHGISLERSWAYSDSISDRPMLEAVGHPVAVNPDRELRRLAMDAGWPVQDFTRPVDLRHPFQPPRPWAGDRERALPRPSATAVALGVGIVLTVSAAVGTAAYLVYRPAGHR